MTDRLLPDLWPLHRIAKELGKATHVLVAASAAGRFVPVYKVGAVWFVRADEVRAWFNRNHAEQVNPRDVHRMQDLARDEVPPPPARRPSRPRARTAASS